MSTLWHPDVCACVFTAASKDFSFESRVESCPEHKSLTPEDAFNQVLAECGVKSHTVIEAQKAYPEIRQANADIQTFSEDTLDPEKVTYEFDTDRKFVMTLQIDAAKIADIQSIVDSKIGADKAIIQ